MITFEDADLTPGDTAVVHGLNLRIAPGELVTVLGPSGCGKSTLLRSIAGFVAVSAGRLLLDGNDVAKVPTERRGVGMVFQNYALFPHLNVTDNVRYGLRSTGVDKASTAERVQRMLDVTGIAPYAARYPAELSGGQQQRVAIARALVTEPRVLLLDEPLSNLDIALRADMRAEIASLHADLAFTAVYVTHDQEEALSLADRVVVLRDGFVEQVGTPREIYERPATEFVCGFVGSASALPPSLRYGAPAAYARPQAIGVATDPADAPAGPSIAAVVRRTLYGGASTSVLLEAEGHALTASLPSARSARLRPGDRVTVWVDRGDVHRFGTS